MSAHTDTPTDSNIDTSTLMQTYIYCKCKWCSILLLNPLTDTAGALWTNADQFGSRESIRRTGVVRYVYNHLIFGEAESSAALLSREKFLMRTVTFRPIPVP